MNTRDTQRKLATALQGIESCELALRKVGPCAIYERSLAHWRGVATRANEALAIGNPNRKSSRPRVADNSL